MVAIDEATELWAEVEAQAYVIEIVLAKLLSILAPAESAALKGAITARRPWSLPPGSGPVDAAIAQATDARIMGRVDNLMRLVADREASIRRGPPSVSSAGRYP